MPRISTKENKTVYQEAREEVGYSRERASQLMNGISEKRIVNIENNNAATPYDILEMSKCYGRPDLCNYYCSHDCEIGKQYIPEIQISDLPSIILETIASLNEVSPLTNRLIEIGRDGKITDDEIVDFAKIQLSLEQVSLASDALKLWINKTTADNNINHELLQQEIDKLKQ